MLCGRLLAEEHERLETRITNIFPEQNVQCAMIDNLIDTIAKRQELFNCLLQSPLDKRDLSNELSFSRSTIDRSVRELKVLELIEYGAEGLTPTRRVAYCNRNIAPSKTE